MHELDLDRHRVRELLLHDRRSGAFTWRVAPNGRIQVGAVAGTITEAGYVRIKIDGQFVMAHRLAWWLRKRAWPAGQLDHRNGHKADNRIGNLREASGAVNTQNQRKAKRGRKTGSQLGAYWVERNKQWRAAIYANGRSMHLGMFDTEAEAHAAYVAAKRELHPGCTI